MNKLLAIFVLLLFVTVCPAQTMTWEDFIRDYVEDQSDKLSQDQLEALTEDLVELHQNPVEINTATRDDLLKLPFLNQSQVDSLLKFRSKYSPILSISELLMSKRMDKETVDRLSLFVYCRELSGNDLIQIPHANKNWNQQVIANIDFPLNKRAGYNNYSEEELQKSPNKDYKGERWGTTWRYRGDYKSQIYWGVTLQKDEGEPFAGHGNNPFDSYSLFLLGKGNKALKSWAVGDFRIHYGLGLTVGQGLWNSPITLVSFQKDTQQGISKHSSADETNYFRGGATELEFDKIHVGVFASYRNLDATIKDNKVSSLLETGYHRTQSELDRKGNLSNTTVGAHLDWIVYKITLGVSALHTHYDHPFESGNKIYRKYYMKGQNFGNYGFHYAFQLGHCSLSGEETLAEGGGVAALNILRINLPQNNLHLIALYRYYDKRYNAPYAFAYSVGGHVQNENGLLTGLSWKPVYGWQIKAYVDGAYHPYATYQATRSSNTFSAFGQIDFSPNDNTRFSMRYRFKNSQKDNNDSTALLSTGKHNWRFQAYYIIAQLKCVTTLDAVCSKTSGQSVNWGKMLSQRISTTFGPLQVALSGAWFNTDNYQTALRLYEPQLLYGFSFPNCFYHGLRGLLMISAKLNRKINLAVKYSILHYTNRNTISSAQQLLNSSTQNNLYFQINWKF